VEASDVVAHGAPKGEVRTHCLRLREFDGPFAQVADAQQGLELGGPPLRMHRFPFQDHSTCNQVRLRSSDRLRNAAEPARPDAHVVVEEDDPLPLGLSQSAIARGAQPQTCFGNAPEGEREAAGEILNERLCAVLTAVGDHDDFGG